MEHDDVGFFAEIEGVLRRKKTPTRSRGGAPKLTVKKDRKQKLEPLAIEITDPCEGCIWESKPKRIIGAGNLDTAKILVVYDRPSITELSKGLASDSDFEWVKKECAKLGIPAEDLYFTSVVRCTYDSGMKFSESGKKEVGSATDRCINFLRKEVLAKNIGAVLLLGLDPLQALVDNKRSSIFHARGHVFQILGKPAVATFSADQVKKRPDTHQAFREAIVRAKRLADGVFGSDYKPNYRKPRTGPEVITALQDLIVQLERAKAVGEDEQVTVDVESMYCKEYGEKALDPWHPEFAVWSIGFSARHLEATAIPFDPHPYLIDKFGLASIHSEPKILELVTYILTNFPCVSHTQMDPRAFFKYKLVIKHLEDSCLVMYACDDTSGQLSVEDLANIYTEEGNYKAGYKVPDTKEQLDWDAFMDYNCHDADIERRLYFILKAEAIERDVWSPEVITPSGFKVQGGYWNVIRIANRTCDAMTRNGMAMDRAHLENLILHENTKQAPYLVYYFASEEVEAVLKFIQAKADGTKKTEKYGGVKSVQDCDLGKTWVLEHLLYDVCKFSSEATTDKGSRSTEAEVLEKFAKTGRHKDLLEAILQIKLIRKKLSTYLTPYVEPKTTATGIVERFPYIKFTGLVHPYFNQHKVRTGRLSSENPNAQNIINDLEILKIFIAREWNTSNGIRRGLLVSGDYAQHEIRMAAWLTRDPMMAAALQFDFHTINLAVQQKMLPSNQVGLVTKERLKELTEALYKKFLIELSPNLDSAILAYPSKELMGHFDSEEEYRPLLAKWKNLFKKKRTVAKESTFGPLYGMQPPTFAAINSISLKEAEEVFALDKETYKVKHAYFAEVKERAKKDGFVQSIFGKKRRLDYKGARNQGQEAALDRQAVNTTVQGPSSDLGILTMGKIMEINAIQGIWSLGIGTVHDSIIQDSHPDCVNDAATIQCTVMEEYPLELLGPGPVTFKADMETGPSRAELRPWQLA